MQARFWLFLKGALMGAADIVPGVSGGTIAFITGIYEELLTSIKSVLPEFFILLKTRDFVGFWKGINGNFLLTLFSGILLSIVSLAKLISFLLAVHPVPLWAFFFGLIVASVWVVGSDIREWNVKILLVTVLGAILAWGLTSLSPAHVEPTQINIFLSGYIAICAMILPGISGSFILLLLGTYAIVLGAIKSFDVAVLMVFAVGCLCGLLSIANLLSWAFKRFHNETLALLTGFMIGALNKVWPWKEVLETRVNSKGQSVPLIERSVSPSQYELVSGLDALLGLAIFCAVLAAVVVVLLNLVGKNRVND